MHVGIWKVSVLYNGCLFPCPCWAILLSSSTLLRGLSGGPLFGQTNSFLVLVIEDPTLVEVIDLYVNYSSCAVQPERAVRTQLLPQSFP